MGWEVLALLDAQGVGAPGWEFCFPLLCLDSRAVEIWEQQNKPNCSSSLDLWPFSQAGFFFVRRIPLSIVLQQGQMCSGISLPVVG